MIDSLHVIGSRQFGGADRFYVRLVRALNEAGHHALAVTRPKTPIARALEGAVEQVHIPMRNIWDVLSVWRIRRLVRSRRPAIVQTYMGRATRLTRLPHRGNAVHVARLGGYYKLNGYYRHAHAWVGNTRGVCEYLVREGLPARSVYFIGNFVEDVADLPRQEIEALRETLGIPPDAVILLAAGRFHPVKGFGDLLRAFRELPPDVDGRPLYLIIIGDGPLRAVLQAQSDEAGVAERVRWPGWQNRPDPFYQLADVFVCPSRHEPLGNVILEAWSHGLPVVATRTLGAAELIDDSVNGLLVPCRDPHALAERLLDLLRAPAALRAELIAHGSRVLKERHNQHLVLDAYLAMYDELSHRAR